MMVDLFFIVVVLLIKIPSISASIVEKSSPFLWGVATSAYQIEGGVNIDGRGPSIWDTFSHSSNKTHAHETGDIADLSYFKITEDVELIRNLSVNAYRFSISWSRIYPLGKGEINLAGVEYYNRLINTLLHSPPSPTTAGNITLIVTLFHWDLPQALEEEYLGWLDPQIQIDFENYARTCFELFGDRVKLWITINEPWTFAVNGYDSGINAPGRCTDRIQCPEGDSSSEPYLVSHNVLNAHSRVVQIYRQEFQQSQGGFIGITLNIDWSFPLNSSSLEDVEAAHRRNEFMFAWFADPIFFGDYPSSMKDMVGNRLPHFTTEEKSRLTGSVDFLGFNHYSSWYVSKLSDTSVVPGSWFNDQRTKVSKYDLNGKLIGPQAASPWLNTVPEGIKAALCWVDERYHQPIILITENGCDVIDESTAPLEIALNDTFRVDYYRQYLSAIGQAISLGVNIRGYFAWSLLDNFEWADGYSMRFGLYYVDYTTPTRNRYPKRSAQWYREYILDHPHGPTIEALPCTQESLWMTSSLFYLFGKIFDPREKYYLYGHYCLAPP